MALAGMTMNAFFKNRSLKNLIFKVIIFACSAAFSCALLAEKKTDLAINISRGAYLARIGDCIACHTAGPDKALFAGGLPINSPFGIIYSTNITPDPIDGIGNYTLDDFSQAVRNGVAKDGRRLYPAMPYPSFNTISDSDINALYAYFMNEVAPIRQKPPKTKLPFPFNIRRNLALWDFVFVKHRSFKTNDKRDEQWNRGAYLVQSLGHCGACHTPRGIGFQEVAYSESSPKFLSGAVVDNLFAANLRGDPAAGLGRWNENDIMEFLKTGHSTQFTNAAFGSMTEVIEKSTQYWQETDLSAIAHYLKSLSAVGEKAKFNPNIASKTADRLSVEIEHPGIGLYESSCAKCHQATGTGKPDKFPMLAGNSIVLSDNPTSLIRLLLDGSKTATTRYDPKPEKMPGFANKFTDQQIAEVLSFIRTSWGNTASRVTTREVTILRKALQKN